MLALVAILGAAAGLAVPRNTGGPMGMEGFRQALLVALGAWGWIGVVLARLGFRSWITRWGFRIAMVASLAVCLPNAVAAPSDCQECFRSPEPGEYGGAALGIVVLWLGVLAIEGERVRWSLPRSTLVDRWLRVAAHGWLGIAALTILVVLLRSL